MTGPEDWTIPGGRYAFQVIHPGAAILRIRYRRGISVDPWGFPDWVPYARVLVELPPVLPLAGIDELRVVDVLTANRVAAATGDPLWSELGDGMTPAGWTWAHLGMSRRIALIPIEQHSSYRHLGGMSTASPDRERHGLPVEDGDPPPIDLTERLAEEAVVKIEEHLGFALPAAYREFLEGTNGGRPGFAAIDHRFGFVADQKFFGVAREDKMQDLVYVRNTFTDRLTEDFLAVGYVQGGLIAVRVRGGDEGSVWYWDDDDYRDRDHYTAADVCAKLLHRLADDFNSFWLALRPVPRSVLDLVTADITAGLPVVVTEERQGEGLPATRRPA